jgi:hypothetical protein
MSNVLSVVLAMVALVLSLFSAYVAWSGLKTARAAGRPASMQNLFTANQAALQFPELLIDVHGVDPRNTLREARALAYFSIVLDGFQDVHGRRHGGDFAAMTQEMVTHGDSLRRFLSVPENARRWEVVKERSYGDFEPGFIKAVDDLIAYESSLRSH